MGMYNNINDIVKVLRNDETLLRLLFYPPKNESENIKDPLDKTLPNILDYDNVKLWEIRDNSIMLIAKSDDLENNPICRIYLYAGRRTPHKNNYLLANQQIFVDILCHESFEKDQRILKISDRINELLVLENITGIGVIDYIDGYPINSPLSFIGFRHMFEFGSTKS